MTGSVRSAWLPWWIAQGITVLTVSLKFAMQGVMYAMSVSASDPLTLDQK